MFEVLAEPNRRRLLDLLRDDERSVGELVAAMDMSQPAGSQHLRGLRAAGMVEARVDAQRRLYRLRPEPLQELDDWLDQFRRLWNTHVDRLGSCLDRMEDPSQR